MAGKRGYNDGCALAHGLELIGERWALLVIRELLMGPKRFSDLQADLPGVSADVLSQRLKELQAAGLVNRRTTPPPAAIQVYELTEWAAGLEPYVTGLARWASRSPAMPRQAPISADSVALSLKALFDPVAAGRFRATIGLRLAVGPSRYEYRVAIAGGRIDIARGPASDADLTLDTDTETLGELLYDGLKVSAAQRSGSLTLSGDKAVAQRFLGLFPLPEPVSAR